MSGFKYDPAELVRYASVYRCYDSTGRLLYVGHSDNVDFRMEVHRIQSPWSILCARTDAEPERELIEARTAERAAIKAERPLFNQLSNPDYRGLSKAERLALYDHRLETVAATADRYYAGRYVGPAPTRSNVDLAERLAPYGRKPAA